MAQINSLSTEPPRLTSIPVEKQEAALRTKWLKPANFSYSRGGTFGERSLLADLDRRAGSAVCLENCTLMSLVKEDYKRFVMKIELKQQAHVNAFLKTLAFFKKWPTKWLTRLQYHLTEMQPIRNQVIYREGEASNHVYLVIEGEFLLSKRVPMKQEHEVQLEKLIGPN